MKHCIRSSVFANSQRSSIKFSRTLGYKNTFSKCFIGGIRIVFDYYMRTYFNTYSYVYMFIRRFVKVIFVIISEKMANWKIILFTYVMYDVFYKTVHTYGPYTSIVLYEYIHVLVRIRACTCIQGVVHYQTFNSV